MDFRRNYWRRDEKVDFLTDVEVDEQHPLAVYKQIEEQVILLIASGKLNPEDLLPGIQKIAVTLNTNVNTVSKAFRDLKLLGYLNSTRGRGTYIAAGAKEKAENFISELNASLAHAVRLCRKAGMQNKAIRATVSAALAAK